MSSLSTSSDPPEGDRPPVSPFERDLRQQAEAYARLLSDGPPPWDAAVRAASGYRALVFAGMGASYHAATAGAGWATAGGLPARAGLASELLRFGPPPSPGELLVAVSQSGESVEVVRLLESSRAGLLVTNDGESAGARLAGAVMPTGVPPDHGVGVKTFGAALLSLAYLASGLQGEEGRWREETNRLVEGIRGMDPTPWRELGRGMQATSMVVLSRGPLAAAGRAAALLAAEVAKVPAWSEDAAQFRHGIIEVAGPSMLACLLVDEGPTAELQVGLVSELRETGARVIATAPGSLTEPLRERGAEVLEIPSGMGRLSMLGHVVPFQWLALGWAEGRGLEPGRFRHARPVVRSEAAVAVTRRRRT